MQSIFWGAPPALTRSQRILFLRQLALILRSGLPLLAAMELLQTRMPRKTRMVCLHLHRLLCHGSTLAEALAREERSFPRLTSGLVAAGELSGQLDVVLTELADYYDAQEKLQRRLYQAAVYPLFLLVAAGCVLLFFLFYVLPMLVTLYAGLGVRPTGMLALLLELRAGLTASRTLLVSIGIAVVVLGKRYGAQAIAWLRTHVGGSLYRLLCEVRFCKLLALLLESGLSITAAVGTIATTLENADYERELLLCNSRLGRGMEITSALAGAKQLLSHVTLDLVGVGSATGNLPAMLREAGRLAEEELQGKIKHLQEVFAPLLLLLAAGVCAGVVVSVLGPLLELLTALPE